MPTNAQIRTIQFMQGVDVSLPASVIDDAGNKLIINNSANASTGLTFRENVYREVVITYAIRRRTDTTALAGSVIVERGTIRLTSNPDAALLANRWIIAQEKDNEGVATGVTFSTSVTLDGADAVVDLLYTSTNLAGANHDCVMSYALTSFLV